MAKYVNHGAFLSQDYPLVMDWNDAEGMFFIAYGMLLYKKGIDLKATMINEKTDFWYINKDGHKIWLDFDLKWDVTVAKPSDFDINSNKIKKGVRNKNIQMPDKKILNLFSFFEHKQSYPGIILKKLCSLDAHKKWIAILDKIQSEWFRKEMFNFDKKMLQNSVYSSIPKINHRKSLMKILDVWGFARYNGKGAEIKEVYDFINDNIRDRYANFKGYHYINGFINFQKTLKLKELLPKMNNLEDGTKFDKSLELSIKKFIELRGKLRGEEVMSWRTYMNYVNPEVAKFVYNYQKNNISFLKEDIVKMAEIFRELYWKRCAAFYDKTNPSSYLNYEMLIKDFDFWLKYEKTWDESTFDDSYNKLFDEFCILHKVSKVPESLYKAFEEFMIKNKSKLGSPVTPKADFEYPFNVYLSPNDKVKKHFVKEFIFP